MLLYVFIRFFISIYIKVNMLTLQFILITELLISEFNNFLLNVEFILLGELKLITMCNLSDC